MEKFWLKHEGASDASLAIKPIPAFIVTFPTNIYMAYNDKLNYIQM